MQQNNLNNHQLNKPYSDTFGAASFALSVAAMLGVQLLMAFLAMSFDIDIQNIAFSISVSLMFQIAFVAIFFVHIKKFKAARPVYDIKLKMHPLWYVLSIVLGIVCLICFIGVTSHFVRGLENAGLNFPYTDLFAGGAATTILVVFTVFIAASVGEELIFRGSLLSGLVQRFSVPVAAVISGVMFSLMHMNPQQTVYQFFLGFAAAYLVIYSKSVISGVVVHAVSNGLVLLMGAWSGLGGVVDRFVDGVLLNGNGGALLSFALMVVGIGVIVGSCLAMNRFVNKDKVGIKDNLVTREKGHSSKTFWTFLIVPLAICVIMWWIAFAYMMG